MLARAATAVRSWRPTPFLVDQPKLEGIYGRMTWGCLLPKYFGATRQARVVMCQGPLCKMALAIRFSDTEIILVIILSLALILTMVELFLKILLGMFIVYL